MIKGAPRRLPDLSRAAPGHAGRDHRSGGRLLDAAAYRALAELFAALGDPTRAKIVHLLCDQEWCSCHLAAAAGVSRSGASQHLRILRALRLVRRRRAGRLVYYRVDDEHVARLLRTGLAHLAHEDGPAATPAAARRTAAR